MDLTPYTQGLRDDLLAAASVGDEQTRRAAALLSTALEPAARLAIMNALSDLAGEITGALDGTTVELRLEGRELKVSVNHHEPPAPEQAGWSRREGDDIRIGSEDDLTRAVRDASGELSRTTLRLVNELKSQAEQAATAQGVSLNTYIQRAVSDAVRASISRGRKRHGGPHTISGYVQG
jgi:hypothetical protein